MKNSILKDEWFLKILPITKSKFARNFDIIFDHLEKLNLEFYVICETGCIRSTSQFDWQGNFTILANRFVEINGGIVYTMNIDENAVALCNLLKNVKSSCSDSIKYLREFNAIDEVNLFYLDSMDIEIDNPLPSAIHHYNEFSMIISRRKRGNFFICVDDNVSDTVQKGLYINRSLKNAGIAPIIDAYQSMYWIDDYNLGTLKSLLQHDVK